MRTTRYTRYGLIGVAAMCICIWFGLMVLSAALGVIGVIAGAIYAKAAGDLWTDTNEILDNEFPHDLVCCPMCHSTKIAPTQGHGDPTIWECAHCHLEFNQAERVRAHRRALDSWNDMHRRIDHGP